MDCLLCTVPFVSGKSLIFYQFLNNMFQPTHSAVYLGGVQRLMTHIILIIEMVSMSLDS